MTQHHQSSHLLVLDTAIEAPEQLIQGAVSQTQVLRLTGEGHPLAQISDYLEQHQTIDRVHLLAHGQPGGVQLGQTWLTGQNLARWTHQLRQWSRLLRPQASVILYGCRTAAGTLGEEFLSHLHQLLGVTVAASTQVVGQGNWQFDRILGPKSSQNCANDGGMGSEGVTLPFHEETLASYPGRFDPIPIPNFLYATDDLNPGNLYIINPETGELEKFENGQTSIELAARTFALSRGTDGVLYYTGTESLVNRINDPDDADNTIGEPNLIPVYRFDPSNPGVSNLIGRFQISEDRAKNITGTPSIVMLGQGTDNKLYALTPQSRSIYMIDVTEFNDSDDIITLGDEDIIDVTSLSFGDDDDSIPNSLIQGGGDVAFDPDDPNVLFFTSKAGSGTNDYRIFRVNLEENTIEHFANLKTPGGNNPNGQAGSLAFAANGDLFFNADTTMYRLESSTFRAAISDGAITSLSAAFSYNFGSVDGTNLSDFASLPGPTAVPDIVVNKEADPTEVNGGDTITYTITVTNNESIGISNIRVSDPIPDGIENFTWTRKKRTIDSDDETEWDYVNIAGEIDQNLIPLLPAGKEAVYRITADVQDREDLTGDPIVNRVTVNIAGSGFVFEVEGELVYEITEEAEPVEIANEPPVAEDGVVTVDGITPITGMIATDEDGDSIKEYVINKSDLSGGILKLNGVELTFTDGKATIPANQIGQLTFEPDDDFEGSSFTYTAIDRFGGESGQATITLNNPPTAEDKTEEVPRGADFELPESLLQGNDTDGEVKNYRITQLPPASAGVLYLGDPEAGGQPIKLGENNTLTPEQRSQLFFRADPDFTGEADFKFVTVDKWQATSDPATITLTSGNAPPETKDSVISFATGTTEAVDLTGLGGTDIEDDDTTLRFKIKSLPEGGTLSYTNSAGIPTTINTGDDLPELTSAELATLKFTPEDNFTGPISFTYAAVDSDGEEDPTPATVWLKTEPENIPPTTNPVTNNIPRGTATRLTGLGGNDPDGEVTEFRITKFPENGTLYVGDPNSGGTLLNDDNNVIPANQINNIYFQPDDSFTDESVTFTYKAVDNNVAVDESPATVTLNPVNSLPDTDDVNLNSPEAGEVKQLTGLGGSDPDGEVANYLINSVPNNGTLFLGNPRDGGTPVRAGQILSPTQLGQLFFRAGSGIGDVSFTYSAIDNNGGIDPTPGRVTLRGSTPPSPTPIFFPSPTPTPSPSPEPEPEPEPEDNRRPSPSPSPSPEPEPEPEPDPVPRVFCPPKPEKPEIPQLAELPDIRRRMPDSLPVLEVDGLEQLNSRETSEDNGGHTVVGGPEDNDIRGSAGDDQIRGGDGHDFIVTGGGHNVLAGNAGDDTLLGHLGSDTIYGGRDDDLILGRGGNNVIWGDRGNDTISGGPGDDIIGGGPQNRTPDFEGSDDLIYGDAGNDTIFGNLGQNSLSGGDGDDIIFGGQGDDLIYGDAGSDTLKGESGNDTLVGSPDTVEAISEEETLPAINDVIEDVEEMELPELSFEELAGLEDSREPEADSPEEPEAELEDPEPEPEPAPQPDPQPDTQPDSTPDSDPISEGDLLSGNQGNDVLFGGAGNDTLFGGDDDDWLDGGSGDDMLFGDRGSDTLYGNQGNNTLVGGSLDPAMIDEDGPDLIYGGNGNDLIFGNRGDDTIFTGNGNNLAFGGQDDDLMYGGQGSDTLKGEFGDDTLLGSPRSLSVENSQGNVLTGNQGNDLILAGHGGDSLYGGDGDDLIFGGDGEDLIFGDRGNDTIHGGGGNDTLVAANGNPLVNDNDGNNLIFTGEGNNLVLGGSGDDSLVGEGGNDTIRGGSGDDIVWGGGGDDLLFGGHGNDTLCGGGGNDTLVAGNGNPADPAQGDNLLIGAAGNNLMFGNGGQDTFQGGLGNDTIFGGSGDVIAFGEAGRNVIFGQRGNDTLAGGNGDALLHGGQGNDVLFGNGGNNTLYGGQGDDTLYSGRGNSLLFGDEGDDLLFGQRGNDTLVGGGGQNGFAITNEAENNLILDFDIAQDAFVLFDGITQDQLTFGTRDGQTLLQRNGQTIAILVDVGIEQVNDITFR
ncbi:DUF4347 domain-containing protein [Sodalinema gerasimenkoae]|uniref:DUF4347 domain-containing protein n=1 Tax=Sodalinema gerasimenkoae TaxID=2862348 RepID=UPI00135AE512|nr:DUF4347 domain-containing protein [Sodalinema gerasimenkoae]